MDSQKWIPRVYPRPEDVPKGEPGDVITADAEPVKKAGKKKSGKKDRKKDKKK
jgi:hypothetical protein